MIELLVEKMDERRTWPTMDLLRSEPMQLVQLIIPVESAHRTISYLGDLGFFQFKDVSYMPHLYIRINVSTFVYFYHHYYNCITLKSIYIHTPIFYDLDIMVFKFFNFLILKTFCHLGIILLL